MRVMSCQGECQGLILNHDMRTFAISNFTTTIDKQFFKITVSHSIPYGFLWISLIIHLRLFCLECFINSSQVQGLSAFGLYINPSSNAIAWFPYISPTIIIPLPERSIGQLSSDGSILCLFINLLVSYHTAREDIS